jgi:Tol biopolymer transport system component
MGRRAASISFHVFGGRRSTLALLVLVLSACGATKPAARLSDSATDTRQSGQLAAFRVVANPAARMPRYDIVIVNADGSHLRVLVGESQRQSVQPLLFDRLSWSPDGAKVAFAADLNRSRGRLGSSIDLYVVSADGTGLQRLTHSGLASGPLWSPDGRNIAFAQRAPSARIPFTSSLWLMTASGAQPRQLVRSSEGDWNITGSWSPDGSLLVFTRSRYDERANRFVSAIYVVRPDGSGLRKLTDRGSDPAWSPDGGLIAFASYRDENGQLSYGDIVHPANELYVMHADGGHLTRLTHTKDINEASPSWSPDSRTIAYQRGKVIDNAEGTIVLAVNADGSCVRPIAADPKLFTWYARPAWRPGRAMNARLTRC